MARSGMPKLDLQGQNRLAKEGFAKKKPFNAPQSPQQVQGDARVTAQMNEDGLFPPLDK